MSPGSQRDDREGIQENFRQKGKYVWKSRSKRVNDIWGKWKIQSSWNSAHQTDWGVLELRLQNQVEPSEILI